MKIKTLSLLSFELDKNLYLYDILEYNNRNCKFRIYSTVRNYNKESYGFRMRLGRLAFNHIKRKSVKNNVKIRSNISLCKDLKEINLPKFFIKKEIPNEELLKQIKKLICKKNASISLIKRTLKISSYTASRYYWNIKRNKW